MNFKAWIKRGSGGGKRIGGTFQTLSFFCLGMAILLFVGCSGSTGAQGPQGPQGAQGTQGTQGESGPLPSGFARGTDVTMTVSAPSNGSYFAAGEQPIVTVIMKDKYGRDLSQADFSTLALYMYGPQETTKTKTSSKLLNASVDRSARPHHYIDLLTNTDVQVSGNTLKYTLQPITDEEAGTYTVSLRMVSGENSIDNYDQDFMLADIQIKTATVESQIVEKDKCAVCHLGADSGQFYFHHVDPRAVGQTGSPSLESWPVRTCKSCHNTDGYASTTYGFYTERKPDPIVNRVHGVHNGKNLKNPGNTDSTSGAFSDYTSVVFPADIKNCTACHTDDRWMTKPSRLACGACHDNVWFGEVAAAPATSELHPGGAFADDSVCTFCHNESVGDKKQVSIAHKIAPPAFQHTVSVAVSTPANGTHFVAGETPTVTITVKDSSGNTINPSDISVANGWKRAYLYVSGPRALTVPVLTKAATNQATPQVYDAVTKLPTTYASNDFKKNAGGTYDDTRFTSTATAITYKLGDVTGLKAGTYSAWVETMPASGMGGWDLVNFQVGTKTEEKKVASNCTSCHADTRMHASYFAVKFNPDICKNCHDYRRQFVPDAGKEADWTTRNAGFGAGPFSRRVHGVHFGRYLDKPGEVHLTGGVPDFEDVIFPQDVRNCGKCHSEKDSKGNELLSDAWKTKPSRLACLACHDSDEAIAHGTLMTKDPTPTDPWNGDETETCVSCHGAGKDYAPEKVHNISNPYKPPYPREPAG